MSSLNEDLVAAEAEADQVAAAVEGDLGVAAALKTLEASLAKAADANPGDDRGPSRERVHQLIDAALADHPDQAADALSCQMIAEVVESVGPYRGIDFRLTVRGVLDAVEPALQEIVRLPTAESGPMAELEAAGLLARDPEGELRRLRHAARRAFAGRLADRLWEIFRGAAHGAHIRVMPRELPHQLEAIRVRRTRMVELQKSLAAALAIARSSVAELAALMRQDGDALGAHDILRACHAIDWTLARANSLPRPPAVEPEPEPTAEATPEPATGEVG